MPTLLSNKQQIQRCELIKNKLKEIEVTESMLSDNEIKRCLKDIDQYFDQELEKIINTLKQDDNKYNNELANSRWKIMKSNFHNSKAEYRKDLVLSDEAEKNIFEQMLFDIDICLAYEGDILNYINQYADSNLFSEQHKQYLMNFLEKNPRILSACHIPKFLHVICHAFEKSQSLTLSEILHKIVIDFLLDHLRKHDENHPYYEDPDILTLYSIHLQLLEYYAIKNRALARFLDNESSMMIVACLLQEADDEKYLYYIRDLLDIGLIKQVLSNDHTIKYCLISPLLLEYFTACHIVRQLGNKRILYEAKQKDFFLGKESINSYIIQNNHDPKLARVWQFVADLLFYQKQRDEIKAWVEDSDYQILLEMAIMGNHSDLASFIKQKIQHIETSFDDWKEVVKNDILNRLKAYIFRSDDQVKQIAEEDGLPATSYSSASFFLTNAEKMERLNRCKSMLNKFFNMNDFNEIKQFYLRSDQDEKDDATVFSKKIKLKRQELISYVKNNCYENFESSLQVAINAAISAQNENSILDYIINSNSSTPIHKDVLFIELFAEQFDKTHRVYQCISAGELMRKPDEADKLADIAKKAAEILPNLQLSPAALGIPIPFAINFPSSVAMAAVIDVCMFVRERNKNNQASRVTDFFHDGMTIRERTDIIYNCAKFLAHRYCDQINKLAPDEHGIGNFAKATAARVFSRIMKSEENVQSSGRSVVLTFFRKIASNFGNVGPEPEILTKSLEQVAQDATSSYEHLVLYRKKWEKEPLRLDAHYRDPTWSDPDRQWNAESIFDHTGIRDDETGICYAGDGQNVNKYGYINSTANEARRRGMNSISKNSLSFVNQGLTRINNEKQNISTASLTQQTLCSK